MAGQPVPLIEVTKRIPPEALKASEGIDTQRRATLTVLKGHRVGTVYRLEPGVTVIGRAAEAEVQLAVDGISRKHAAIALEGERWILNDLRSTNGTICRGQRVDGAFELRDGDRISLGGEVILRFSLEGELEEALRSQLYELATRDPLTSAYNRRFFEERMDSEWPWAVRHERSCALLLVDIDRFKSVNDRWGHPAGDYILQQVATVIRDTIRQEDLLARVGGEEFAVLCRGTALTSALILARRLREAVAKSHFVWSDHPVPITISIGVGTSDEDQIQAPGDLLKAVDRQLYLAKEHGRNRVEPNK